MLRRLLVLRNLVLAMTPLLVWLHLRRRRTMLCEYCIRARIVFQCVTSEHNLAFVFLKLRFTLCFLEMTDVRQRRKKDCSLVFLCLLDDLSFALYFGHLTCWHIFQLLPQFAHHCGIRDLNFFKTKGMNLCTTLQQLNEFNPLPAMRSS